MAFTTVEIILAVKRQHRCVAAESHRGGAATFRIVLSEVFLPRMTFQRLLRRKRTGRLPAGLFWWVAADSITNTTAIYGWAASCPARTFGMVMEIDYQLTEGRVPNLVISRSSSQKASPVLISVKESWNV